MNQPLHTLPRSLGTRPSVCELTDARWDAWVDEDPLAHPLFCGPVWARSAAEAFMAGSTVVGIGWDHGGLICTHDPSDFGYRFVGCDKVWAYPRNVLGQLTDAELRAVLRRAAEVGSGRTFVQVGLQSRTERLRFLRVIEPLGWACSHQVATGSTLQLHMPGGTETWLSGRRSSFQRTLLEAERRCATMELSFVRPRDAGSLDEALRVVWDVERRSWKERAQEGPRHGAMRVFCDHAYRRAADRGELLISFLSWHGEVVAYHAAWQRGRHGYGFQMSFDEAWRASAPGVWLHWCVLQELSQRGVCVYDLGMRLPYKLAWANACTERTAMVVALPRGGA